MNQRHKRTVNRNDQMIEEFKGAIFDEDSD